MEYKDASVLITGASRGIGRIVARAFARRSDRPLILLARNRQQLEETRQICLKEGAGNVHLVVCDASREADVNSITLNEQVPPPAVLVNNAGRFLLKPLQQTSGREFEQQVRSNLFTAVHITQRFLPALKNLDRGVIINICSKGAEEGLGESGAYSASKHALLGYTRSLREELKDTEIAVTAINLGQTESPSWEGSSIDPERLIDPEDIGHLLTMITELSSRTVIEEVKLAPQHGRVPPI